MVSDVILAQRRSEDVSIAHDVFEEKLIHRLFIVLFRVVDFVLDLCINNMVLLNYFRLPRLFLVGFSFISSFIEYMIYSLPHFPS